MLGAVLLFGVLAGIDNLQVCSSIGFLPIDRRQRHLLALAFSLCETAAPLVGLALGHLLLGWIGDAAAKAGPLLMLLCGAAVLMGAFQRDKVAGGAGRLACLEQPGRPEPAERRLDSRNRLSHNECHLSGPDTIGTSRLAMASGHGMLFGLPLSLSLDNLLGGAGISALGYPMVPAALLIGLVSAAMSCAGLYLGGWLRRLFRERFVGWCLDPAVGAYLCLLAVRLLVANRS
jgi:putative Mn2+ efflux pump MntP